MPSDNFMKADLRGAAWLMVLTSPSGIVHWKSKLLTNLSKQGIDGGLRICVISA